MSGDTPKSDIVAQNITNNVTYTNGTIAELSGVTLTYRNGALCP